MTHIEHNQVLQTKTYDAKKMMAGKKDNFKPRLIKKKKNLSS